MSLRQIGSAAAASVLLLGASGAGVSGDGEELDVRAAFAVLQKRRGDIVRVNDAQSTVRIWIDEGK